MKRKIIIVISIIVVIFLIILCFELRKKNTLEIKILDAYGEEIKDYENNKMPFTIEKKSDNQKIIVNGEEYQEGKRIYEIGEYEIKISNNNKNSTKIVKINKIEKNKESEYNIYITEETLQTLFTNLKIAKDTNQKGFFWTKRTTTINLNELKDNFKNLNISKNIGELKGDDFKTILIPEIKEYIKNILKQDSNAYFHLYTEENSFYLELELFGKIGLNDSRYDFTIYSNGTLSYVREYEITQPNKYERFLEEKNDYFKLVDNIKSNTLDYNDYPGSYFVDEKSPFGTGINYDYLLISTLKDNVKYFLQYPDLFEINDEKISQEMKNANIEKIVAQDEYNKLNEEEKAIFFKTINLDKSELDNNYFKDDKKNYLIITGTVPFYENYSKDEFENILKQIYVDYNEEYNILYKPHPRAIPDEEQSNILENLGINILPGGIPMEAILFIYPNVSVGGFGSSLYMSVDENKTKFFIANSPNELVEPLNKLYNKLFQNVKLYNKNTL